MDNEHDCNIIEMAHFSPDGGRETDDQSNDETENETICLPGQKCKWR